MKKTSCFLLSCVLLFSLFVSCSPSPQSSDGGADSEISRLEEEIRLLRESLSLSEEDKKNQISALKQELEALKAQNAETSSQEEKDPQFTYDTVEGGILLTGFEGECRSLVVPCAIDGLPVVGISSYAFAQTSLESVIICDGVVSIDWFAFYGCTSLASVTLPKSIQTIGHAVFDGCSPNLTILCPDDSFAKSYCKSYGISYTLI